MIFSNFALDLPIQQPTKQHGAVKYGRLTLPIRHSEENMKLPAKHNNYVSDHTLFIAELKAKNPGMEAGQQAGRALLWDKPAVSIDEQERQLASAVKQQAYVYQNKN